MTREEAIKTLKENCCVLCAYCAKDMDSCDISGCDNKDAIKVLEQDPLADATKKTLQMVIDVPENLVCEGFERPFTEEEKNVLIKTIGNGKTLPKGHGKLVYMSEVLIKLMQFYDGDKTIGQCLDEVNTIIEADRA